jgi:hypothetical protein
MVVYITTSYMFTQAFLLNFAHLGMKGFELGQPRLKKLYLKKDQDLIATWKMTASTTPQVNDHHSQSPHEDDSQEFESAIVEGSCT